MTPTPKIQVGDVHHESFGGCVCVGKGRYDFSVMSDQTLDGQISSYTVRVWASVKTVFERTEVHAKDMEQALVRAVRAMVRSGELT